MSVRVFISYSHDSPEHMDRVLALSNKLREDGVDCIIDRYQQSPPEGWPRWTMNQLQKAEFILVVCSDTYERRLMGEEPAGIGRGAKWEGAIITQELYDAESRSRRFVPILPALDDPSHVPILLRGAQNYSPFKADGSLNPARYEELYRLLTDQPPVSKPDLGPVKPMPPLQPIAEFGPSKALDLEAVQVAVRPTDSIPTDAVPSGGNEGAVWRKWLFAGLLAVMVVAAYLKLTSPTCPSGETSFDYSYFEELPYALFHSLALNRDELYWLRLQVCNNSESHLSVYVTCEAYKDHLGRRWALCLGQEERRAGKVASYVVDPQGREPDERVLNPGLRLLVGDNFSQPKSLKIEWSVLPSRAGGFEDVLREGARSNPPALWQETAEISVAPKTRFYPRLADNKGREVNRDLLLASLAAWTKVDSRSEEGKSIASEAGSLATLVRRVYEELLQGESGLRVTSSVSAYPPEPYEVIRPASFLWSAPAPTASPLEAALFVGALAHTREPVFGDHLVLVWPGSVSAAASSLLLAWRSGSSWQAIDLAACHDSYEGNLAQASNRASALLKGAAADSLARTGVHRDPDDGLAAIDFGQAAKSFKIEGLP